MSPRPWLAVVASAPPMGLLGLGLGAGARALILDTLAAGGVQLAPADPGAGLRVAAFTGLAVALAAPLGALAVGLAGRAGRRPFTPRRFGIALGAAALGAAFSLATAAVHLGRTVVPAALAADPHGAAPLVDLAALDLPAWAASGVLGGLVVYTLVSALVGLLGDEP